MDSTQRLARIAEELNILCAIAAESAIMKVEIEPDCLDRVELRFQGRGLARHGSGNAPPVLGDSHRIEVGLPLSFPDGPPELRWLTPIFHPNVSYSGIVNLQDIQIEWSRDQHLAAVAERLWDVARCASVNLDRASNHAARSWFQNQSDFEMPVDARTLVDAGENRIAGQESEEDGDNVFFIGEDTPAPDTAIRIVSSSGCHVTNSDDVLYIGDE